MSNTNELRTIAVKDIASLLDRIGAEHYTDGDVTRIKDKDHSELIAANSWIVTMNTSLDGMAADLIGVFRYAFKLGKVTIEDLSEVISPELLEIVEDALKVLPMQFPNGELRTLDGSYVEEPWKPM
ncbi:hypothetical protein ACWD7C_34050 [Streptomyces sp. NPDC005134]